MATVFDTLEIKEDGSGVLTKNTIQRVITTTTYTASDMRVGVTPICDKKELTGNVWTFTSEELPITVTYALLTPVVRYIDKSLMPTIQVVEKANIISIESPVAPSEFKVSVPVDRIGELETRLAALEGVAYSASNMSLSTNYIDDEYNKNLQTESEMI